MDLRNYHSSVTVRGQCDESGDRITASDDVPDEIAEWSRKHLDITDPEIETEVAAEAAVRQLLTESIRQRETTGSLGNLPKNLSAGPSYEVEWSDGTTSTVASQEVSYRIRAGSLQGALRFHIDQISIGMVLPALKGGLEGTKRGF